MRIEFAELPIQAQKAFSESQKSYIDEFTFDLCRAEGSLIDAYYAGQVLATWRPSVQRWEYNAARCNVPEVAINKEVTGEYPSFPIEQECPETIELESVAERK